MAKANLKPARSPERERLSDAQERLKAAEHRLANVEAAEQLRFTAAQAARRVAEAAAKAVDEAREPERVAAEFLEPGAPPAASLADAERRLGGAQAEVTRLTEARVALEDAEKQAEAEIEAARREVRRRVAHVIRSEFHIGDLLATAREAQESLTAMRVVLRWLAGNGFEEQSLRHFLMQNHLPGAVGSVEFEDWSRHPATAPWNAAVDALLSDPDAPLPG